MDLYKVNLIVQLEKLLLGSAWARAGQKPHAPGKAEGSSHEIQCLVIINSQRNLQLIGIINWLGASNKRRTEWPSKMTTKIKSQWMLNCFIRSLPWGGWIDKAVKGWRKNDQVQIQPKFFVSVSSFAIHFKSSLDHSEEFSAAIDNLQR